MARVARSRSTRVLGWGIMSDATSSASSATPGSASAPTSALAPRLIVSDGDAALDFYARAFDSSATDQFYDGDRLVNGHVLVGTTLVGVTEEDGILNHAPSTIGGTPVLLSLTVLDVDLAVARFVEAGGEVEIPIDNRPYGRRDSRLEDPFGHLWILGQELG